MIAMLCTFATKEWLANCCCIPAFCNLMSPFSIQEMYDCDVVSCQYTCILLGHVFLSFSHPSMPKQCILLSTLCVLRTVVSCGYQNTESNHESGVLGLPLLLN